MARRAIRKTDYGSILLHWTLVVLLVVTVGTGLRIAIDSPHDLQWLRRLDMILPQSIVWTAHIPVGTALFALSLSYAIYIAQTGLFRRIRPDFARLKGLFGSGKSRNGALNIILYWSLFIALLTQMVTGAMLYIGYGGLAAEAHLFATWVIIGYVPCHIAVHYAIGGRVQLLRIFNPAKLAPPTPEFDPFDIILARVYPEAAAAATAEANPGNAAGGARTIVPEKVAARGRGQARGPMVQAHPFPTAIAGGLGFLFFLLSLDSATRDTLKIDEIAAGQRPVIDGDVSDPIWRVAGSVRIPTQQGGNLDAAGESMVEIRAVHDGTNAFFSFIWDDPTRSLKHLPLLKTDTGWQVFQEGFDRDDANAYFEDKFAVLLISKYVLIPGDRSFHAGRQPLRDKPASLSGRGMHYTTDGGHADMWQWHASSGGLLGWIEDAHLGPPAEPTEAQIQGTIAYKGGFSPDPGDDMAALNFERRGPGGYTEPVTPKRLPKDWRKSFNALGIIDPNPDNGDGDGSIWWLTQANSVPYSAEGDKRIPNGAIIPGVIVSGSYSGDRGDVRGAAKWASGRWSLEAVRRLDTGSKFDTRIATGSYMRVSVFDHTQSRHTRHIRPIRLEVNRCGKVAECMSTEKDSPLNGAKSF